MYFNSFQNVLELLLSFVVGSRKLT
uniref:Uncharacterized protein n=1 Tax=Arundo donax TaxID=35708 RepID=A0A0A9HNZ6_ARUDO